MKMNVKGNDNFRTPDHIFKQLNDIFNFTLDAACTTEDCKCERGLFYDDGIDALKMSWGGNVYSAIHLLAKRPNLSQRHIMKSSTANVPLSLWSCPRTAWTAAPSTNTYTNNSIMKFWKAVSASLIQLPEKQRKEITPEQLLFILRKVSQDDRS